MQTILPSPGVGPSVPPGLVFHPQAVGSAPARASPPGRASPPRYPYGGYLGVEMWPDGELRLNDPLRYRQADAELISVLRALAVLNRTGLYSAFYDYQAHVGQLRVQIYEGRWNRRKDPVIRRTFDCRRHPLRDADTGDEADTRAFLQYLILLVQ